MCVLASTMLMHAADKNEGKDKDAVYGVKSASTISVRITGGGVRKPGVYYIQAGATLHDLIANDKAEWLRSSNGRFRISRYVDGKKTTIEKDYTQLDVKLLDGDEIYAGHMTDGAIQPNHTLLRTPTGVTPRAVARAAPPAVAAEL